MVDIVEIPVTDSFWPAGTAVIPEMRCQDMIIVAKCFADLIPMMVMVLYSVGK
jgi:hypothetical protein